VASLAMGLQNATITRISGAVIRTTHLTGVTTDLAIESVQLLLWWRDKTRSMRAGRIRRVLSVSRRHPTSLRVLLLLSIIGSFLLGAILGTRLYSVAPRFVLLLPITFLLFIIFMDWRKPIADVKELDLLADPELAAAGIVKSLLPQQLGLYRLSHHRIGAEHDVPDFGHWVERLPRKWQVVILAVSPLTRLTSDAFVNLSAAVQALHQDGRDLILCGITPAQYRAMEKSDLPDVLDPENICPDIEFAIARGMALIDSRPVSPL
jgi:anti-anti-sigma regulatory factor